MRRTRTLIGIGIVALLIAALARQPSAADVTSVSRGAAVLPAPEMVVLTESFVPFPGACAGSWAVIPNSGAGEGKILFLQSMRSETPCGSYLMPSANFPARADQFCAQEDWAFSFAGQVTVLEFDPPLVVEAGMFFYAGTDTSGGQDYRVMLTGFYGLPDNIIINSAPMTLIPGDLDLDGDVDLTDFVVFAENFTG